MFPHFNQLWELWAWKLNVPIIPKLYPYPSFKFCRSWLNHPLSWRLSRFMPLHLNTKCYEAIPNLYRSTLITMKRLRRLNLTLLIPDLNFSVACEEGIAPCPDSKQSHLRLDSGHRSQGEFTWFIGFEQMVHFIPATVNSCHWWQMKMGFGFFKLKSLCY